MFTGKAFILSIDNSKSNIYHEQTKKHTFFYYTYIVVYLEVSLYIRPIKNVKDGRTSINVCHFPPV